MKATRNESSTTYVIPTSIIEAFDNGLVVVHENPEWNEPDTPTTSRNAALGLQEVVGDNICAILYLPTGKVYYDKEGIKAFQSVVIGHVAEVILVKSFGAKLLGSFALKFSTARVPRKVLSNREEAEKWLLKEILRAKLQKNRNQNQ
ncbi:MAG: hypothetical protein AB8E82_21135 [Aureispira sp.]